MKAEVNGRQIELEPNSKPYLLKRLIADGFDTVLIFLLFSLAVTLLMKTPLARAYHENMESCRAIESAAVERYGGDAEEISRALSENDEYSVKRLAANLHAYLIKAGAGFAAELLILLAVPLMNPGRETPGKLMCGIMPFNEKRHSRVTAAQIIYRFVFVLLIDSLLLYLVTGVLTFLLVPLLRLTEMLLNGKKNKTLCDLITGVTIIEKLSYDGINKLRGG